MMKTQREEKKGEYFGERFVQYIIVQNREGLSNGPKWAIIYSSSTPLWALMSFNGPI